MTKQCVVHASGCGQRAFGATVELLLPRRDILAKVFPSRAPSMGFAPSIPHGKRLLGEDCLLWLKLCAAGVEGVTGFLAKGSPPSLSACAGMVSEGAQTHTLECRLRFVGRSQIPYRFERRVFCNRLPSFSRRLFPSPGSSRW